MPQLIHGFVELTSLSLLKLKYISIFLVSTTKEDIKDNLSRFISNISKKRTRLFLS